MHQGIHPLLNNLGTGIHLLLVYMHGVICPQYCRSLEPDLDWAEKLILPVRFSAATNKVVESGKLTSKARVEIVTALSTLMLVHTSRPTPSDLTTVCRRLVEKYPKLRDKVDSSFVSQTMLF